MKIVLAVLACAASGLVLLARTGFCLWFTNTSTGAARGDERPGVPPLAGTVLAAPYQVLRAPFGGRVTRVYVSEGQLVKTGAMLLKLTVGAGPLARPAFVLAPVAGDVTKVVIRDGGLYVAAGTPYARLTPRGPVRVRVAAAAAARLWPGDSLRIVAGPAGLVGLVTPLTARLPDPATATTVLVLGRLGWPPGTSVRIRLAPLHPRTPESVAAN